MKKLSRDEMKKVKGGSFTGVRWQCPNGIYVCTNGQNPSNCGYQNCVSQGLSNCTPIC